jgi:hypothetical protein
MTSPVKEITITRAEGPCELCDKPQKFSTWEAANKFLASSAVTAPDGGAYDKCDFEVEWVSGEKYEGRFDLERKHLFGGPLLQTHIKQFLGFLAGTYRPPHMMGSKKADELWKRVREMYKDEAPGALEALQTWDLG